MMLAGAPPLALVQVEPVVAGDSPEGYLAWLTRGEAAGACRLVTLAGEGGEFRPLVSKPALEQAARDAGFVPVRRWETPDGRDSALWRRTAPPCPGG
jgi:hypothetical protein